MQAIVSNHAGCILKFVSSTNCAHKHFVNSKVTVLGFALSNNLSWLHKELICSSSSWFYFQREVSHVLNCLLFSCIYLQF